MNINTFMGTGEIHYPPPPNILAPLGKTLTRCWVDTDRTGDKVTRILRTWFIIFLNNAPIYWIAKK